MIRKHALWTSGMALLVGILIVGCTSKNKTNSDANTSVGSNGPSQNVAAVGDGSPGAKIFNAQNCTKCHSIGAAAEGGPRKKDLATVGKDHDLTYISDHIRNAKQHKPQSRMPDFPPDKISDADLKVLSEYLAGLK